MIQFVLRHKFISIALVLLIGWALFGIAFTNFLTGILGAILAVVIIVGLLYLLWPFIAGILWLILGFVILFVLVAALLLILQ